MTDDTRRSGGEVFGHLAVKLVGCDDLGPRGVDETGELVVLRPRLNRKSGPVLLPGRDRDSLITDELHDSLHSGIERAVAEEEDVLARLAVLAHVLVVSRNWERVRDMSAGEDSNPVVVLG